MNTTDCLPQIQGIQLIGTHQLPNRIQPIFPFPVFNAIQSKCFQTIYRTDDNFVLSAPTGSGKTAILELSICRLAATRSSSTPNFKVVYQAPTKSLCSERARDWADKFQHLGLKCAELTGDTKQSQLKNVQSADILVTTPEKWDSITRRWRDHRKLMELVKLFLIDEVHILKEDRGASLEAVVSRMKSVGSEVRFVALSATVPNSEDIAAWLGRSCRVPGMPAAREVFGEEFRPVKLKKYVVGVQGNGTNDFAFDGVCCSKLPEVISRHSARKPIMIFCMTRASAVKTAEFLAEWWAQSSAADRYWEAPRSTASFGFHDPALRACVNAGVAFHHAGLTAPDRSTVERGYLNGDINVICCTSTLAAGVNLPCHFVIIKNTVSWQDTGPKEYSDLDVMQMLGRAGRPQFDQNAVAVILTRLEKITKYENLVSGQETLESKLHLNLVEHLNAEVVLGTIKDLQTAKTWLEGTFLYQRYRRNPGYYRFEDAAGSNNPDQVFDAICNKDIDQLREFLLITNGTKFKATEFGDAMARYYVQFETMKTLMCLPPHAKISEIISAIAQASELKQIRLRASEKQLFKDINASPSIKFPIPVDLALTPHKISLMIQATLGGMDAKHDDVLGNNKTQFLTDLGLIIQHVPRLVKCLIDCALVREDSVTVRNALELARSLGARIWDDSPLQLMQVQNVGPAAARKLGGAGIKTIEDLEDTEAQKIDMILSRNPPFGSQVLRSLAGFPKLRVSLQKIGSPKVKTDSGSDYLSLDIKAEVGFLNDEPPTYWKKTPVHVTLLAETSDGRVVHFARLTSAKIGLGEKVMFEARLLAPRQLIHCYVACDEIAGTLKSATLDPKIPPSAFPQRRPLSANRPRSRDRANSRRPHSRQSNADDFEDAALDDSDLMTAANGGFEDIEDFDELGDSPPARSTAPLVNTGRKRKAHVAPHEHGFQRTFQPESTAAASRPAATSSTKPKVTSGEPRRLPNGNWVCLHACTDKTSCRHLCCREGTDKKPRPSKKRKLEMEQQAKEASKSKSSPIDDFFKQGKKVAASLKPTVGSRITRPPLDDGFDDDDFGADVMDDVVADPFEEDLLGSRRSRGDTVNERGPMMSKTAPTLRPSHGGLFLTSSPDKRAVETVNLSGESEERATKQPSATEYHTSIAAPELESFGASDDFGDEDCDFIQEDEAFPKHVRRRSIRSSLDLGPFEVDSSIQKEVAAQAQGEEHLDGDIAADSGDLRQPASDGSGITAQEDRSKTDVTCEANADRLRREDDEIKQWLLDEFGDCVEFV